MEFLYTEIGKILGLDKNFNIIIIGAGNLGQAIANYKDFEKRGFSLIGIFDINPKLYELSIRDIPISNIDELESFIKENKVDIAALTVPRTQSATMSKQLVDYGIKAIWNFAPVDLNLPEDIVVENVHLAESLMQLSYALKAKEKEKKESEEKD